MIWYCRERPEKLTDLNSGSFVLTPFLAGASRLPMLRLTTHNNRCLEAFHCSNAVRGWWSIATWV